MYKYKDNPMERALIDVYAQNLVTYAGIISSDFSKKDLIECLKGIKEIMGKLEKKINSLQE